MRGRRHTPEQIVRKLREADPLLGEGQETAEVVKLLAARPSSTAGGPVRGSKPNGFHRRQGLIVGAHGIRTDSKGR
jgi:hypothetical protein